MNLQQFVQELSQLYGPTLQSIVLYGATATQDPPPAKAKHNIIIVLSQLSPAELRRGNRLVRKWVRCGHPLPLFFDPDYIAKSHDVFPIEFSDILHRHRILFGADPFRHLTIRKTNLRHQCESELRGKLAYLRSYYILAADRPRQLTQLMTESISSIIAVAKGVLLLKNQPVPDTKEEVVAALARLIQFDSALFLDLIRAQEGRKKLATTDAASTFEHYLTSLDGIIKFTDSISL